MGFTVETEPVTIETIKRGVDGNIIGVLMPKSRWAYGVRIFDSLASFAADNLELVKNIIAIADNRSEHNYN